MEAFRLLSRGGTKFDKKRFDRDVKLFNSSATASSSSNGVKVLDALNSGEVPNELDFFKYAAGGSSSRAVSSKKGKGKATEVQPSAESDDNEHRSDSSSKKRKRAEPNEQGTAQRHRINTTGKDVPAPIVEFDELLTRYSIPPQLLKNLSDSGYTAPTAIQSQAAPILLESRDLSAISPTGTGKTLSYVLPIFSLLSTPASSKDADGSTVGTGVRALILSPTRELASQIYNECLKLAQGRKWRIVLYSKATGATLAQKEARDKTDIVISTPLRLVDALKEGNMELDNVRHLIFDEADRLLESGFLSQIEEIIAACTHPKLRKAVFSATLPAGVEAIAKSFLFDPIRVVVGLKDAANANIKQSLVYVGSESGKLLTLRQLLASSPPLPLLIFVQSRERATELHQELIYDGISVDVLHADMTPKQRETSVSRMRRGETWVMVCTEVMARGMDFGGLRGVLNYDFPQSVQSYVHRIGRTGRAGRDGDAITYFTDADAPYLKAIANVITTSGQTVPPWILSLPKPSKLKRRQLRKAPVERKSVGVVAGRGIGKGDAVRRRDMVMASKKRKIEGTVKTKKGGKKDGGDDAATKADVDMDED
ncbi:P-loop containing nucleoside triphosphate hydrolase protein [Clavulina sp. PMI_390]|nr:P-loop containing nucleoside triphosphate hydrolase protein [Clavulina sp. PMI_390]